MDLFCFHSFVFLFICPVRLEISNHEIFHYFFPILYSVNWFATTYVCLLMITPVLNILLKKLTKRQLEIFLLSFLLFQSLLPTILQTSYQLNELGWFIVLYFIAAYLRNHCQLSTGNWRNHLLIAVILYFMLWGFYTYSEKYMYENSFLVILIALELFLAFIKMEPFYNQKVNIIASATFGVYLIHDNPLMRSFLWGHVFKNQSAFGRKGFIVYSFFAVLLVFVSCTIIDLVRQKTIEKFWIYFIDNKIIPYVQKSNKIFNIILSNIVSNIKSLLSGNFSELKYPRRSLLIAFLLTSIVIVFGALPLYVLDYHQIPGKTELLYTYIKYTIKLLYLMFPLLFVLNHICQFIFFTYKSSNTKKCFISIGSKLLYEIMFLFIILYFYNGNYWTFMQNFLTRISIEYFLWAIILVGSFLIFWYTVNH